MNQKDAADDRRGQFITFEGGEGAGKSTQIGLAADWLTDRGIDHIVTREPGGSPGAEEIRRLLVEGEPGRWDAVTEMLLHFAARRDHVTKIIQPALAHGRWVLCDRYVDSTLAYQGYGHQLGEQPVRRLADMTIGACWPNVTFILDIDVADGLKRAETRTGVENRYEQMALAFHQRLRDGFLAIAAADPARCHVVNADKPLRDVAASIRMILEKKYITN